MKNIKQALVLLAGYYHYFLLGCFIAVRGFLLPQIKDHFGIDYTTSALMLVITALPSFIVSLLSGHIFGLINRKLLLLLSSGSLFVFFVLIPASDSYVMFLVLNLFMGLSMFILGTGVNVSIINVIDYVKPKFKDNGMVLLHLVYSIGGSLILLFTSFLQHHLSDWRTTYFFLGMAFGVTPLLLLFSKYPPVTRAQAGANAVSFKTLFSMVLNRKLIFYSICIFFYGGLEFCLISWGPTFFEKGLHREAGSSLITLCLFFLLYCLGRLAGVLIIHKVNKVKLVIALLSLSALCLTASFVFRIRLMDIDIFFSLTGLFLSVIFPTIQTLLSADFKDNLGTATSIFLVANATGSVLLPFFIGVMNDVVTAEYGILFVFAYFLFIVPSLFLAAKGRRAGATRPRPAGPLV